MPLSLPWVVGTAPVGYSQSTLRSLPCPQGKVPSGDEAFPRIGSQGAAITQRPMGPGRALKPFSLKGSERWRRTAWKLFTQICTQTFLTPPVDPSGSNPSLVTAQKLSRQTQALEDPTNLRRRQGLPSLEWITGKQGQTLLRQHDSPMSLQVQSSFLVAGRAHAFKRV